MKQFFQLLSLAYILHIPVMARSDTVCDSTLTPVANELLAYKQRNSNKPCEGFYRSRVSVANLDVVGLSIGRLGFDSSKTRQLIISSPLIKDQAVKVRLVGIPLRTYYRLDTLLEPGETLLWSLQDVLALQKVKGRKIGLYGRLSEHPKVYVPLAIDNQVTRNIVLTLRSPIDIAAVSWCFANVINDNCTMPKRWKKLNRPREFRGGRAIDINLPTGKKKQLCVEVAAKPKKSSNWLKKKIRIQVGHV